MRAQTTACLFGAILCVGACRDTSTPADGAVQDLAQPSVTDAAVAVLDTTIRDLNTAGKVAEKSVVKVTGVVISPTTWIDTNNATCTFEASIAQPDQTPSLKDGIALYYSKALTGLDGGNASVTKCRDAFKDIDLLKLTTGHTVEVTGRFETATGGRAGMRQIFLTLGNGAVDKGDAPVKPAPVVVQVKDLDSAAKLAAAASALVQVNTVKVTDLITGNPIGDGGVPVYGFKFSDASGTATLSLDLNYVRVSDKTFVPPAKDAMLSSVIGIIHVQSNADYSRLWARTKDDIVQ